MNDILLITIIGVSIYLLVSAIMYFRLSKKERDKLLPKFAKKK